MVLWDRVRSPVGIGPLIATGRDRDLTAEQCLHGTGLVPAQLEDPATEIRAGRSSRSRAT